MSHRRSAVTYGILRLLSYAEYVVCMLPALTTTRPWVQGPTPDLRGGHSDPRT